MLELQTKNLFVTVCFMPLLFDTSECIVAAVLRGDVVSLPYCWIAHLPVCKCYTK